MDNREEMAQLRYEETMEAIHVWLKGQGQNRFHPSEALGIAKAFLTHASLAIVAASSDVATGSEADETDSERLRMDFFRVALQFVEEKRDKLGN